MIKKFTLNQQKAIEEKLEQLRMIKKGFLKPTDLAEIITIRRLNWLKENMSLWENKNLSLEDAYGLLIYNHMKVEDGILMGINNGLLKVECRNFCPYLEASKILNLDIRFVCKEIGEPSLVAFFQHINPRFYYSRDYNFIRPHQVYCKEFLEEK